MGPFSPYLYIKNVQHAVSGALTVLGSFSIQKYEPGPDEKLGFGNQFWIGLERDFNTAEKSPAERRTGWHWQDKSVYNWSNWFDGNKIKDSELKKDFDRSKFAVKMHHDKDGAWFCQHKTSKLRYICKTGRKWTNYTEIVYII